MSSHVNIKEKAQQYSKRITINLLLITTVDPFPQFTKENNMQTLVE